jgi:DNA polymerase III epsilon subunit-like protein
VLVFDLETNGLLHELTKIWTLTIYDTYTKRYTRYDLYDVPKGIERLSKADAIVGHNIISFDLPAIKKVFPDWTFQGEVLDTLVWARLVFPDIRDSDFGRFKKGMLPGQLIGSHSLEAWGYRLGVLKGSYGKQDGAWNQWTPEMSAYCEQDVRVTVKLLELLQSREVSPEALDLEHAVARIITRQMQHGFHFDQAKAEALYIEWVARREELRQKLHEMVPPFYLPKDKEPFVPKANNKRFGYIKGAPCTRIELTEFNPSSNQHIAKLFQDRYGWKPTEFTEKTGEPKIDENVLKGLDYPEAKLIAEFWVIQKRISQLAEGDEAWLKLYDPKTGAIHGYVNSCGAVTGRMTHSHPNIAQVPASYSPLGAECRSLFTVRNGFVLVGIDAEGLEARCLAHYLAKYDNGAFTKTVLEGKKEDGTDIHSLNAKALGGIPRDTAKTWFYAWMYGAGLGKLAKILGCSEKQAKAKYELFLKNMPAFKRLKEDIDRAVKKRGFLWGLDRRQLKIRSSHSALNTLLQSAGAVVMKKALVLLDQSLQDHGLVPGSDYEFCANVHDEWQIKCCPDYAVLVGELGKKAIQAAGKHFKFKCPLDGDYAIGLTWAETH